MLRLILLGVAALVACDRGWGDLTLRARGLCSDALNKSLIALPRIDRAAFLSRCEVAVAPGLKKCAVEHSFGSEAATRCLALDADPAVNVLIDEERQKAGP